MNRLTNTRAAWVLIVSIAALYVVFAIGMLRGQLVLQAPTGGPGQIWITFSGGTPAEPGVLVNAELDPQGFTVSNRAGKTPLLSVNGSIVRHRIDYPAGAQTLTLPAEAAAATVEVHWNGVLQREGLDYTRAGQTITLVWPQQQEDLATVFWY